MPAYSLDTGVMVPMRDGVRLATDIYRPAEGTAPTLLARTPYNKDHVTGIIDELDVFRALRAGYAVVTQDVRGRYASEGIFDAFRQEPADGADTIAWVAGQPWSNGDVGTFGKSYLGVTQWQVAPTQPPALRAMAPSMTPSDSYEGNAYQGGATVGHVLGWAVALSAEAARRRVAGGGTVPAEWSRDLDYDAAVAHLPLSDHPAFDELASFWPQWMSHPSDGPYWRSLSHTTVYDKITVPALNIGGWYDILLGLTLQNYRGARHNGGSDLAAHSRLIVGPWSHVDQSGRFPDRDFGQTGSRQAIDLDGIQLAWFDRWVKATPNGTDDDAPVPLFVMGADTWRRERDWPLPDTIYTD